MRGALLLQLLDQGAHVTQAAGPLRIAYIAGALSGRDTGVDPLHHGTAVRGGQFGANAGLSMPETVAHEYLIVAP